MTLVVLGGGGGGGGRWKRSVREVEGEIGLGRFWLFLQELP